jgi:hypothetical protein
MITREFYFPALNTSGAKVENKEKVKKKVKVKMKTPTETTTIKVERDEMPIHRCDVKVKV